MNSRGTRVPSSATPPASSARRLLLLILAALLVATASVGAATSARASDTSVGDRVFQLLNAERARQGLKPLQRMPQLDSVAQAWSGKQARDGRMSHNPNYYDQYPSGWTAAAENVAWTDVVTGEKLHSMWMGSDGHRKNMLNPAHTHVGVGIATVNGRTYATENFAAYRAAPEPAPAPSPEVERWSGADRYAVAANISARTFAPGIDVAYVANGVTYADALSAAPVAGMGRAPVLLTTARVLPAPVRTELQRLQPRRIVVLGGTASVSTAVQAQLDALTTGTVERWSGPDRYAVSAGISARNFAAGVDVAYIANGTSAVDALSAAPVAGKNNAPILLTMAGRLPTTVRAELDRLDPEQIVILGGTGAVSSTVEAQLRQYTDTVLRWSGPDRFTVSAVVSKESFTAGRPIAYVANGFTSADALAAAPVAAMNGAPLLLTKPTGLPGAVLTELRRLSPGKVVILGGTGSVSTEVQNQLSRL